MINHWHNLSVCYLLLLCLSQSYEKVYHFYERTYYVIDRPSVCLSVCPLSSVTFVRSTQAIELFVLCFYAVWYLGHPLTYR